MFVCDRCGGELPTAKYIEHGREFECIKHPNNLSLYSGITGSSIPFGSEVMNKKLCFACYNHIKYIIEDWLVNK